MRTPPEALALVEAKVTANARSVPHPYLIMLCGLPGVGKTHLARVLCRRLGVVCVESDGMRHTLVERPTFSQEESRAVFDLCHALVQRLLEKGYAVVMDATNLLERHREAVYVIAERCGVPLFVTAVRAPEPVVRARLERRAAQVAGQGRVVAGWEVYLRMRREQEPIARRHFAIDTSKDLEPALARLGAVVRRATAAQDRDGER